MVLEVSNLESGYGAAKIVQDVSFSVDSSEVVAVLGPNGAGKSTLLKTIVGLVGTSGGTVEFQGEDITDADTETVLDKGIVYVPQDEAIFPELSVIDNLRMNAWHEDIDFQSRVEDVYDQFPILEERSDQIAGTLSGGQRRMLAVSPAIMYDPDLIVLDEPSAGLAPQLVEDMFSNLRDIIDQGTSVLLVEQNADEALRIADRGLIFEGGQILEQGSAEQLQESGDIAEMYLGGEDY